MPRIRSIHPQFWNDERMAELPFGARLLFIGTWTFADDEGRLEDNPARLRLQIFPGDDMKAQQVDKWLDLLAESGGPIIRYEVDGRRYIQIRNWRRYQSPTRPTRSRIPPPPANPFEGIHMGLSEDSLNTHRALSESHMKSSGIHGVPTQEREGGGGKGTQSLLTTFVNSGPPGPPADTPRQEQRVSVEASGPSKSVEPLSPSRREGVSKGISADGGEGASEDFSADATVSSAWVPQVVGEGRTLSMPLLRERMKEARSGKDKVAVLVDFVKVHAPEYGGPGLGDRAAGLLRGLKGDGRRALALLLRAVASRPDGDVFSYAQALARKTRKEVKARAASRDAESRRDPEEDSGKAGKWEREAERLRRPIRG